MLGTLPILDMLDNDTAVAVVLTLFAAGLAAFLFAAGYPKRTRR